MESIISIRAFPVNDPEDTVKWGLLGETDNDEWTYQADAPPAYQDELNQYRSDELDRIDEHQPTSQTVIDGVVIVLDELVFRVVEDEIEYEFRLSTGRDLEDGQTICSSRNSAEYGGTAERFHDDERIADGLQRAADTLGHRIQWLDVISPRSFTGVAQAADDLVGDDEDE